MSALTTYKLVLVDQDKRIVVTNTPRGFKLPMLQLDSRFRMTLALSNWIAETFGTSSIQLACAAEEEQSYFLSVHELLNEPDIAGEKLSRKPILEIASLLQDTERILVDNIISMGLSPQGRYSRFGWFERFMRAIEQDATVSSTHWNFGVDFCLISYRTNVGSYWLKGVGNPNLHEYEATSMLSVLFPHFVPTVRFAFPAWSAWVADHVTGFPLAPESTHDEWKQAFSSLADLQILSLAEVQKLSSFALDTITPSTLLLELDEFFVDARRSMQAQSSHKVRALTSAELNSLHNGTLELCKTMDACSLPISLLHRDLGVGNIIVQDDRAVFLDWAEIYLGTPLISSEILLEAYRNLSCANEQDVCHLRKHFISRWKDKAISGDWDRGATHAQAFSVVAVAVMVWKRNLAMGSAEQAWPMMRSLLRRLQRELEVVEC